MSQSSERRLTVAQQEALECIKRRRWGLHKQDLEIEHINSQTIKILVDRGYVESKITRWVLTEKGRKA